MLPSSSSSSKLNSSSYTVENHDASCHVDPANANAVQHASKHSRDTNDDGNLHSNDKNKRPRIACDGTSHNTVEEDKKIRVIIQDLSDTSRYWLCFLCRIPYTILGQNGYGEDEGDAHDAALVEDLVSKYSSLTDGYSLLNDDIVTINNYSREKYDTIWDYTVMLDEYGEYGDEGGINNAMASQTDDTQNITHAVNNNSSNIEVFDGGDGSSDNNFTSDDNHWDNCCDGENAEVDGELSGLTVGITQTEQSASPKQRSSPTSVSAVDTSTFTTVEDDDNIDNTKHLQQSNSTYSPHTNGNDNEKQPCSSSSTWP